MHFWNNVGPKIALRSTRAQTVVLRRLATRVELERGEGVIRDVMRKFTPEELDATMAPRGFHQVRTWTDARDWYGLFLYRRGSGPSSAT